jgi:uncharacterized protein
MPSRKVSLETIRDFLGQKRIAMVGISRNPANFSVKLFEELSRRGYAVIPVNPTAQTLYGQRCYARVQDIQPRVDGVLLMTSPRVTESVVRDCAAIGIPRVWMYRAGGQGAVSESAVEFCQEHGIRVVPGECPFMFLPNAGKIHSFHGLIRKITGRYPQRAAAA